MNRHESWWETAAWAGTVAVGFWLSMRVAQAMVDLVGSEVSV
jgi:hypothetical protein